MTEIQEIDRVRLRHFEESTEGPYPYGHPVYPGSIGTVVFAEPGSEWLVVEVLTPGAKTGHHAPAMVDVRRRDVDLVKRYSQEYTHLLLED